MSSGIESHASVSLIRQGSQVHASEAKRAVGSEDFRIRKPTGTARLHLVSTAEEMAHRFVDVIVGGPVGHQAAREKSSSAQGRTGRHVARYMLSLALADGRPYPLRRGRHIQVANPIGPIKSINDCVHHRRG
jgi:hypothetical protein